MRTRIKICGFTREQDVDAAVAAGADALGFVLYPKSPRCVSPERAAELARLLPPFVTPVLLFVNESAEAIAKACALLPNALVQLHGDESPAFANSLKRPYIKAARLPLDAAQGFDLPQFCQDFASAQGILLDAKVESFGGSGQAFDWARVPQAFPHHLLLSAGLKPETVGQAVVRFAGVGASFGVDVSSGVETAPGIKDADKMQAFCLAVRRADAARCA
jgi:phosphoribosylanthranilate isomerase